MPLPDGYILRHPGAGEAPAVQAILDACETADTGEPRRHDTDVANEWRNPRCHPDDGLVGGGRSRRGARRGRLGVAGDRRRGDRRPLRAPRASRPRARRRDARRDRSPRSGAAVADAGRRSAQAASCGAKTATSSGAPRWSGGGSRRSGSTSRWPIASRAISRRRVWPAGSSRAGFRPGIDDEARLPRPTRRRSRSTTSTSRGHTRSGGSSISTRPTPISTLLVARLGRRASSPDSSLQFAGDGGAMSRRPRGAQALARSRRRARAAAGRRSARCGIAGTGVARLYVDAQNVTNAVRVYEAAGMHVSRRFDVLEKPLA